MAEKGSNKKAAKPASETSESGVLASLPATRPNRMGRRGRDAQPVAKAAPKPAAKARSKAAAKRASRPASPKRTAADAVTPIGDASPARPRAVRAGSPKLADHKAPKRAPQAQPSKAPSGTELAKTVVQAAGELAQVGLTVSGQILKRAVDKLPKP